MDWVLFIQICYTYTCFLVLYRYGYQRTRIAKVLWLIHSEERIIPYKVRSYVTSSQIWLHSILLHTVGSAKLAAASIDVVSSRIPFLFRVFNLY